jgi:hypothetical protein
MLAVAWLNLTQLSILGVEAHHVYWLILLILLSVLYLIISPVVQWMMARQSRKLLSYILSSFLFLIVLISVAATSERLESYLSYLLKISLQGFSIFGVFLLLYSIYTRFIKKQHGSD